MSRISVGLCLLLTADLTKIMMKLSYEFSHHSTWHHTSLTFTLQSSNHGVLYCCTFPFDDNKVRMTSSPVKSLNRKWSLHQQVWSQTVTQTFYSKFRIVSTNTCIIYNKKCFSVWSFQPFSGLVTFWYTLLLLIKLRIKALSLTMITSVYVGRSEKV